MKDNKIHEKYSDNIGKMLVNGMPYYGFFNQSINFIKCKNDSNVKTACVNVTKSGMMHYYNPDFIDKLSMKQTMFLLLHETFHLLLEHNCRFSLGKYDHRRANIAMDMIINSIIVRDISKTFIDVPKYENGENMALFMPKEYDGLWIFEDVYDFLKKEEDEKRKRRKKKEEEKIFDVLHFNNMKIVDSFIDSLTENSKNNYIKYIKSFINKCIVSITNDKVVKIFSNTSTNNFDYTNLSIHRTNTFKNELFKLIEEEKDIFQLSKLLLETLSYDKQEMIEYIIKEEFGKDINGLIEREYELNTLDNESIKMVYQQYYMTYFSKYEKSYLEDLCLNKQIKILYDNNDIVERCNKFITFENMLDTDKIIINDLDDKKCIISDKYNNKYSYLSSQKDSIIKLQTNNRISYEFDESMDNSIIGKMDSNQDNGYGQNAQNGEFTHSLEEIFNDEDKGVLDSHIDDEVDDITKEQIITDVKNMIKNMGSLSSDVEQTLNSLQKRKKDYTKEIKKQVSYLKGVSKEKSIKKINRRGIFGIKGKKKVGYELNVILDTSYSMNGYFENALSYIFKNDIKINLIMCDVNVKSVSNIKSMKELQKVRIKGLGGTILQPAVNKVIDGFNKLNTIIITDGYTDTLDFSKYNKKVLVLSTHKKVPTKNIKDIKQVIIK